MGISWKIPNEKVIDVKWVYSKKSDDTYKARLQTKPSKTINLAPETPIDFY